MNPMERFTTYFQGSTQIWMITLLLAVFSFLPVFSASTNVYMHSQTKHFFFPFFVKAHLLMFLNE